MKMVSTGLGRTTCSCFLPGDENHLRIYSSWQQLPSRLTGKDMFGSFMLLSMAH
jgi:hypothetical protein